MFAVNMICNLKSADLITASKYSANIAFLRNIMVVYTRFTQFTNSIFCNLHNVVFTLTKIKLLSLETLKIAFFLLNPLFNTLSKWK
jgi:hypothetical protein